MTDKNILIVGNGNHQFIKSHITMLRKSQINHKFDLFSLTPINSKNKKYYNEIFQIKYSLLTEIISKIYGLRRLYRKFLFQKTINKLQEYDIIHFHYVGGDTYFIANQIKEKNRKSPPKVILSIWGSDMYRVSKSRNLNFLASCNLADVITFTNEKSMDFFKTRYNWEKQNLKICRFGLDPLVSIRDLNSSKTECKNILGWDKNKLTISIGYNASPNQQHIEIINTLNNSINKEYASQIQFIFQLTYGGSKKYKTKVINLLNQLSFDYIVYETFLEYDKIALVRKASDIMIQLQTTDQFSGSMQEHIYAQNVVITGSWLPYDTLKEKGVWFLEVNEIHELKELLPKVITNYDFYESKTNKNPKIIEDLSSWESNIQYWIDLYNS